MKTIRKMSALICAVGIALTQYIPAMAVDSGKGTASEPYKISSEADFYDIEHNPSGNYVLTRDITVSKSLSDTDFSGKLDGNGHIITVNDDKPFFKTISGTVENTGIMLEVKNGSGIFTDTITGTLAKCYIYGDISSGGADVLGGVAGIINGGEISDCYVNVRMLGSMENGGAIAGKVLNSKVTNCFVTGGLQDVKGAAIGNVAGVSENSEFKGVYYSYMSELPYGIGMGQDTTTFVGEADAASSCASFDFGSTWMTISSLPEPFLIVFNGRGTASDPYKLHHEGDVREILNTTLGEEKYYKLENDINIEFTQIGDEAQPFIGHFDGANHVMANHNSGVFGVIGEGSVVENLRHESLDTSSDISGGIAAINYGTVQNCYVTGLVSAKKDSGGIVGENIGGTVKDCLFEGEIRVNTSGAGGIVGYNSYGTIENCASVASVYGKEHGAGGIAGDNSYGTIKNCSAKGSVRYGSEIGGIAGRLYNGSIINSYSMCNVAGADPIGGIFGAQYEDAYVENSYYRTNGNDSELMNAEQKEKFGRTALEMADSSTYTGFDFNNVWSIYAGDESPALRSVYGAGTKEQPYKLRKSRDISGGYVSGNNYYELANDIKVTDGNIKFFSGSLDGKGYTITIANKPLIGEITDGAYVGNVHIIGSGLASDAKGATIEYCTVSSGGTKALYFVNTASDCVIHNCKITDAAPNNEAVVAGSFVSNVTGGSITDCAAINSSVKGSNTTGGFIGVASGASIKDCIAYGTAVEAPTAGGFIGRNDNGSTITGCAASGVVNGGTYAGAFVGMNYAAIDNSVGLSKASDDTAISFAGYDDGKINNSDTETAEDIYKIIATGGIGMAVNTPIITKRAEPAASKVTLSDISGHWAEATITKLVGKGVINGYEDGTYRPQNSVTKGEFLTLLLAATNTKLQDGFTDYEDVNKHWAKKQVYTAIKLNLTDNIAESQSSFGVDNAITRAEAVALMGRLIAKGESGTLNFTDNADIPDWAKNEVGACVSKGIINGMDDGSFAPNKSLTRAESAIIIDKLMELK